MNFLKRLRCKHVNKKCLTNIYGDIINDFNCRSIYVCKDCGKYIPSNKLDKNCKIINFYIEKGNN